MKTKILFASNKYTAFDVPRYGLLVQRPDGTGALMRKTHPQYQQYAAAFAETPPSDPDLARQHSAEMNALCAEIAVRHR